MAPSEWDALSKRYGLSGDKFLSRDYLGAKAPVPTGPGALDGVLGGGMHPGIHVLGGEPGAGKSALGIQIALLAAYRGSRVLYASLEMSASQCRSRCLSLLSMEGNDVRPFGWGEVPKLGSMCREEIARRVRAGEDRLRILEDMRNGSDPVVAASALMDEECSGLVVADSPGLHGLDALLVAAEEGAEAGMHLMVIDYLQFVDVEGSQGEYERVSEASRALSGAAKRLDVPILAISSLSRQAASGDVGMHAFRGSGSIEYDAESAWVLARGRHPCGGLSPVTLSVVKNRRGPLTDSPIQLAFDGAHNVMREQC